VVSPDEMVERYGADSTRVYSLFAAPPDRDLDWQEAGVEGVSRFLSRVYRLVKKHGRPDPRTDWVQILSLPWPSGAPREIQKKVHQTLRKITQDFEGRWHFNTSIAGLMELVNDLYLHIESKSATSDGRGSMLCERDGKPIARSDELIQASLRYLTVMLAPFSPYLAAELWEGLDEQQNILRDSWPQYDAQLAKEEEIEIPIQMNGKNRSRMVVPAGLGENEVRERAVADEKIRALMDGKQIVKVIVVPDKLVNIVVR
jgi:leucyl-tRNA synthetase